MVTAQSNNSEKNKVSPSNSDSSIIDGLKLSSKINGVKISPKTDNICLCCNKNGVTKALIFLDGKPITNDDFKNLDSQSIESMEVLKNQKAIELYGEKAKDGVIFVLSKKRKG